LTSTAEEVLNIWEKRDSFFPSKASEFALDNRPSSPEEEKEPCPLTERRDGVVEMWWRVYPGLLLAILQRPAALCLVGGMHSTSVHPYQ
jgi:hypothetical protein